MAQLETQFGERLYHPTGLLEIGPEDGVVISGVLRSAGQFGLPIERLTMPEAKKRFPGLEGEDAWSVVLEKDAGYLNVEKCVRAHLDGAAKFGAKLIVDQKVIEWKPNGSGVRVQTQGEDFFADRLILAGGPWAGELLMRLQIPLQVLHKHLYWFEVDHRSYRESDGFPCFFYETPTGHFYGFPQRDALGLKIARHSGGEPAVSQIDGIHERNCEDESAVEAFLAKNLPDVSQRMTRWSGCYYTMTPDEHFIVDTLPNHPQATVVAGLSGHGFKFTSVLGELAADLSTERKILRRLGVPPFITLLHLGDRQDENYRSWIRKNSELTEFLRIQLRVQVQFVLPLALASGCSVSEVTVINRRVDQRPGR